MSQQTNVHVVPHLACSGPLFAPTCKYTVNGKLTTCMLICKQSVSCAVAKALLQFRFMLYSL